MCSKWRRESSLSSRKTSNIRSSALLTLASLAWSGISLLQFLSLKKVWLRAVYSFTVTLASQEAQVLWSPTSCRRKIGSSKKLFNMLVRKDQSFSQTWVSKGSSSSLKNCCILRNLTLALIELTRVQRSYWAELLTIMARKSQTIKIKMSSKAWLKPWIVNHLPIILRLQQIKR